MTQRPNDNEPEPPGGRAAERLREFIDQRFPGEVPANLPEEIREEEPDAKYGVQPGTGQDAADCEEPPH